MDKNISFSQAFHYVTSTSQFWWGLGITLIILSILWAIVFKVGQKRDVDKYKIISAFVTLASLGIAIFGRSLMVRENTSVEAAARGNYIGW